MFYISIELSPSGTIEAEGVMRRVEKRADATELTRTDADFLLQRARELWPDSDWVLDRTFTGKFVAHSSPL
jgi:hypothetical protein